LPAFIVCSPGPAALDVGGIPLWYEQHELTGNAGSVWLFTVLSIHGHEKPFRLFVASMEIAASILVIIAWTRMWGAAFALSVLSGAFFFHEVIPLGIDPYHDGGAPFKEAGTVWLCAAFILLSYRIEISAILAGLIRRMKPATP
jgi:hypothetical protein